MALSHRMLGRFIPLSLLAGWLSPPSASADQTLPFVGSECITFPGEIDLRCTFSNGSCTLFVDDTISDNPLDASAPPVCTGNALEIFFSCSEQIDTCAASVVADDACLNFRTSGIVSNVQDTCTDPGSGAICGPGTGIPCHSPIIVDTAGNGFNLTSAQDGVHFDIDGTGQLETVAWTAQGSDDGFLALDRNHDGVIDSGRELFGNITEQPPSAEPNGFVALGVFDQPAQGGNSDGVIDARDAEFSRLVLWIDGDHDGASQPYELQALPEVGVTSLSLHYRDSRRQDAFGNWFRFRAKVNPEERQTSEQVEAGRWAYDVFLVTN